MTQAQRVLAIISFFLSESKTGTMITWLIHLQNNNNNNKQINNKTFNTQEQNPILEMLKET